MSQLDKYFIDHQIGEGCFGKVYKGRLKWTGKVVACKFISKKNKADKDLENLRQEIDILYRLDHPNIIKCHESIETVTDIIVVTELGYRDLFSCFRDAKRMPENTVRIITKQLCDALSYLHSHRILHRDLKPQNILVGRNGTIKLADFGFARAMSQHTHVLTSIKGTPLYMAPELMKQTKYNHKVDIWSAGVICFELFNGEPPFNAKSLYDLVSVVTTTEVKHRPDTPPDFVDFINKLLVKNPEQRADFTAIFAHPFLRDATAPSSAINTPNGTRSTVPSDGDVSIINTPRILRGPQPSPPPASTPRGQDTRTLTPRGPAPAAAMPAVPAARLTPRGERGAVAFEKVHFSHYTGDFSRKLQASLYRDPQSQPVIKFLEDYLTYAAGRGVEDTEFIRTLLETPCAPTASVADLLVAAAESAASEAALNALRLLLSLPGARHSGACRRAAETLFAKLPQHILAHGGLQATQCLEAVVRRFVVAELSTSEDFQNSWAAHAPAAVQSCVRVVLNGDKALKAAANCLSHMVFCTDAEADGQFFRVTGEELRGSRQLPRVLAKLLAAPEIPEASLQVAQVAAAQADTARLFVQDAKVSGELESLVRRATGAEKEHRLFWLLATVMEQLCGRDQRVSSAEVTWLDPIVFSGLCGRLRTSQGGGAEMLALLSALLGVVAQIEGSGSRGSAGLSEAFERTLRAVAGGREKAAVLAELRRRMNGGPDGRGVLDGWLNSARRSEDERRVADLALTFVAPERGGCEGAGLGSGGWLSLVEMVGRRIGEAELATKPERFAPAYVELLRQGLSTTPQGHLQGEWRRGLQEAARQAAAALRGAGGEQLQQAVLESGLVLLMLRHLETVSTFWVGEKQMWLALAALVQLQSATEVAKLFIKEGGEELAMKVVASVGEEQTDLLRETMALIVVCSRLCKDENKSSPSAGVLAERLPRLLRHADSAVRAKAAQTVAHMVRVCDKEQNLFDPCMRPLVDLLDDRETHTRRLATVAIGNVAYQSTRLDAELQRAVPKLSALLDDPDEKLRGNVAATLGNMGHNSATLCHVFLRDGLIAKLIDLIVRRGQEDPATRRVPPHFDVRMYLFALQCCVSRHLQPGSWITDALCATLKRRFVCAESRKLIDRLVFCMKIPNSRGTTN